MTIVAPLAQAECKMDIELEVSQMRLLATLRGLKVYTCQADQTPYTIREIGRIRELVFRNAGAGRGAERDLDALDFGEKSYHQLLVWDPRTKEIVALYRFQYGYQGTSQLRTANLFQYSDYFTHNILPHAIELGRSVVNPEAKSRKFGFFALWAGLEALLLQEQNIRFLFGNVSLYQSLTATGQSVIVSFCQQLYRPRKQLLTAHPPLQFRADHADLRELALDNPRSRIQSLQQLLTPLELRVPSILQSYMSLGHDIWFDEAAYDEDFGDAVELSIVVPVEAINPQIRKSLTTKESL